MNVRHHYPAARDHIETHDADSGAKLNRLTKLLLPANVRIPVTFFSVLVALVITGIVSARASGASVRRATFRVVIGGAIAMLVTYGVGRLTGGSI